MPNSTKNLNHRVIVIDDDKEMRQSLIYLLSAAGWEVEALAETSMIENKVAAFLPDVILSDVRMPNSSGLDLLSEKSNVAQLPIVLISAHGDIPTAVQAMRDGAYSFLEKPFDPQRLLTVLRNAAEKNRLSKDAERLRKQLATLSGLDRVLLGKSEMLQSVRESVLDFSSADAAALILGETGTGKELVARALHNLSDRANGPFLAINCATIEAEGFEKRVFGEAGQSQGLFRQAEGGTLFLDEIGTCTLDVQAKLLRAIELREILPVGADKPITVNVRIVSASNEPLDQAINDGRFRSDLYFRLNNVVIDLPTLRSRKDDIPLLFEHFLQNYAELYETQIPEVTTEDMAILITHEWPGNVRELRNVAERLVLASRRGAGSVSEALRVQNDMGDVPETLREAVAAFERTLIAKAIRNHKGKMDAVAEALGIGRRTLNEKIVKLNLNKSDLLD
ncbi:sigma-54-dependent transcriptional regulator [Maritalea sp.]|uniref:sigma-54-dependent transcriptional regulator n=1 Tax=Maritalea sp. TaxID=2003361 RepID=UPI003EF820D0